MSDDVAERVGLGSRTIILCGHQHKWIGEDNYFVFNEQVWNNLFFESNIWTNCSSSQVK